MTRRRRRRVGEGGVVGGGEAAGMIRGKKEKWAEEEKKTGKPDGWMQMNSTSAAHRWPRPFFNSFRAWPGWRSPAADSNNSHCGCTTERRAKPGEKVQGVSSCRAAAAPAEAQIRQRRKKKRVRLFYVFKQLCTLGSDQRTLSDDRITESRCRARPLSSALKGCRNSFQSVAQPRSDAFTPTTQIMK